MGTVMQLLRKNQLVDMFFKLRGNARACIWTEPLWGVPYNLYRPYVTRFMIALGLSLTEIGMITTISYRDFCGAGSGPSDCPSVCGSSFR